MAADMLVGGPEKAVATVATTVVAGTIQAALVLLPLLLPFFTVFQRQRRPLSQTTHLYYIEHITSEYTTRGLKKIVQKSCSQVGNSS